jgi:isopenicillin-N N-acyltransferase-like protein
MFPQLLLKGNAYEIGYNHGSTFRSLIRDNIDIYFSLFFHYAQLGREEVISRAHSFIPFIEGFDREIMEEMRGIAEGSGNLLEEIVALNARTEIMFKDSTLQPGECTALAVTPEASSTGHTLIGQNWDWMVQMRDKAIILEIEQKEKPRILTFTEAGFVGKIGMNTAGVGLCANLLVGPNTVLGIPFHLFCRGILNSSSLGEAISKVLEYQSGASGNFLIAHAEGEAIDIETSPHGSDYLYSYSGFLTHTNHFESKVTIEDIGRKLFPDTILRFCRSGKFLDKERGRITLETFQKILQDHFNYPNAICRHPDPRLPELEQMQTNASVLMDLTDRVMFVCQGNPCTGEYLPLIFTE